MKTPPKINIITPPDKIFSTSKTILLIHPGNEILTQLQDEILINLDEDINVYNFKEDNYDPTKFDWLISIFHYADIVIINVDNLDKTTNDLLSYFISHSKTYWLTNYENPVYNHISNNRIYNLDFIKNGGYIATKK